MDGFSDVIDMHHHFVPKNVFQRLVDQAGGARRLATREITLTLDPALG